ncbi:MAG: DNA polymerase IV [Candidatus Aminicenantia bacterium]
MERRRIIHLDMDAFFVSVERVFNPSLRSKPVIVGGDPNNRGVVCSASYEARRFGVRAAMPLIQAKELCPQAIFLPPHYGRYRDFSHKIYQILQIYSPIIERASIDEFYLDFTGCERIYGDIYHLAEKLKQIIRQKTDLPCSIGVGSNKLIAKIASSQAKPEGLLLVPQDQEAAFLHDLPLTALPGIGRNIEKKLREMGIRKIGELAEFPLQLLINSFGKVGENLWNKSRGIDFSLLQNRVQPKTLSQEITLNEDSTEPDFLKKILSRLVEELSVRLRGYRMKARRLTIKIRYSDFRTVTFSERVEPTNIDSEIYKIIKLLFERSYQRRVRVRLLGIIFSHLISLEEEAFLFEDEESKKKSSLYHSIDTIRKKFGQIIHLGSSVIIKVDNF